MAGAILRWLGVECTLKQAVRRLRFRTLRVLEINEAGSLSRFLSQSWRYTFAQYPEHDMTKLTYADESFDLVVHSDTLEHVPTPERGLAECRRVLRKSGACCYTVPVVVGRLTRTREGLPPSYHGREADRAADYTVQTEFGADFWAMPLKAGFAECRVVTVEYPTAQAVACLK